MKKQMHMYEAQRWNKSRSKILSRTKILAKSSNDAYVAAKYFWTTKSNPKPYVSANRIMNVK
jgi:hypothetical protein